MRVCIFRRLQRGRTYTSSKRARGKSNSACARHFSCATLRRTNEIRTFERPPWWGRPRGRPDCRGKSDDETTHTAQRRLTLPLRCFRARHSTAGPRAHQIVSDRSVVKIANCFSRILFLLIDRRIESVVFHFSIESQYFGTINQRLGLHTSPFSLRRFDFLRHSLGDKFGVEN